MQLYITHRVSLNFSLFCSTAKYDTNKQQHHYEQVR
jgi:hypothetical protein